MVWRSVLGHKSAIEFHMLMCFSMICTQLLRKITTNEIYAKGENEAYC